MINLDELAVRLSAELPDVLVEVSPYGVVSVLIGRHHGRSLYVLEAVGAPTGPVVDPASLILARDVEPNQDDHAHAYSATDTVETVTADVLSRLCADCFRPLDDHCSECGECDCQGDCED